MNQVHPYITWKIVCDSPDEAEAVEQWVSTRIGLDRTIVDTVRTMPNGVEHVETVRHRLGDYFSAIHVEPARGANAHRLQIRFERRLNAGRFWRDLMVNILQEIEASPQKPSVVFGSQGEPQSTAG